MAMVQNGVKHCRKSQPAEYGAWTLHWLQTTDGFAIANTKRNVSHIQVIDVIKELLNVKYKFASVAVLDLADIDFSIG